MTSGFFKKIYLITFFVLLILPSFSQKEKICIGEELFTSYYNASLDQLASSLGKRKWWLLSNEIGVPLQIGQDTLIFNLATWKNTLTFEDHFLHVYYEENLSPYFELLTTQPCYEALLDYAKKHYSQKEEVTEENVQRTVFLLPPVSQIQFIEQSSPNVSYSVVCYNKKQLDSVLLVTRERRRIEEEIYQQKKERIEFALATSDELAEQEKYEQALVTLETLTVSLPDYHQILKKKKEDLREEIKRMRIAELITEAELLFDSRELEEALHKYEQVLQLDPKNETALIRKDQIGRMQEILTSRSTTFYDYSVINPDAYYLFKNSLSSELNHFVEKEEKGMMSFDLSIRYDTLGMNRSDYLMRYSIPDFSPNLDHILRQPLLTPTYREDILVASGITFHVNLGWGTSRYQFVKNNKRIKSVPKKLNILHKPFLINYLSSPAHPNGRYFFDIKEKNSSNQHIYTDIHVAKYKTVGPEAFIYSMLFPGAGTMAATQGKKGIGAMISFITVGGASTAAFFYGRSLARKAEKMILDDPEGYDQRTYQRTVDNSKIFQYTSYVGFSITGVIYIADAIHALTMGIQNKKASKELRKSLRKAPIVIDSEEIVL